MAQKAALTDSSQGRTGLRGPTGPLNETFCFPGGILPLAPGLPRSPLSPAVTRLLSETVWPHDYRPPFKSVGAWLACGALQLHLTLYPPGSFRTGNIDGDDSRFAFRTDDLEGALATPTANGFREDAAEDDPMRVMVRRNGSPPALNFEKVTGGAVGPHGQSQVQTPSTEPSLRTAATPISAEHQENHVTAPRVTFASSTSPCLAGGRTATSSRAPRSDPSRWSDLLSLIITRLICQFARSPVVTGFLPFFAG